MRRGEFIAKLLDAGWRTLAAEAWNLRPAEVAALLKLMRCAGRPVGLQELAGSYDQHLNCTGTSDAVRKRVERVRAALADVGLAGVVQTIHGEGYGIEPEDTARIQWALAHAVGFSGEPAA